MATARNGASLVFLPLLQVHVAEIAITASALRNQGAPGVVASARKFLGKTLDLRKFSVDSPVAFRESLDKETGKLKEEFPSGARNWGAARKALNIFLRDVLYNRYLCKKYGFSRLESWLEVPLDSEVAHRLCKEPDGVELPPWESVSRLTPDRSDEFQKVAERVAAATKPPIARVHLDLIYWRSKSK